MAFAIMGGLAVASLLTLIVIPTLYVTWESLRGTDLRQGSSPLPLAAEAE